MITEQNIIDRNFTLYADVKEDIVIDTGWKEYLAEGTRTSGTKKRVSVISLTLYNNNEVKITNWFNQPLFPREFFFLGEITTVEELDTALEKINFDLKKINLNELHKYK